MPTTKKDSGQGSRKGEDEKSKMGKSSGEKRRSDTHKSGEHSSGNREGKR